MRELVVTKVDLERLVFDPQNPRTHDERNLKAIKESLIEHGQVEPLLVQRSTKMVIAGNGRMEAMRGLGWESANVVILDVDDTEARRLSIALNRSGELAGWNESVLTEHLNQLSSLGTDWNPDALGFDQEEIDALLSAYSGSVEELTMEPPKDVAVESSLPPGTSPSPMPTSTVRMVQLFLDETTIDDFQMAIRKLAQDWDTDNITDTVYRAVMERAGQQQAHTG